MELTPTQQQLFEVMKFCKKENEEIRNNIAKGLVYAGNMADVVEKMEKNTILIEKIRMVLNSRPQAVCPFQHTHPSLAPSGTSDGVGYVNNGCCIPLQF